jgi:hypothetical protein
MGFIRSLFIGTRPFWTVGVPVFTLVFFVTYWFVLCPAIWNRYHLVGNDRSEFNLWLFAYWVVAAAIWAIVFFVAYYLWKKEKKVGEKSDSGFDQHLLSSQPNKTTIPLSLTTLPIQPKYYIPTEKIDSEVTTLRSFTPRQNQMIEAEVTSKRVQPLMLKTMPPSRPSESDFTWDTEDISWMSENGDITSPSYLISIAERDLEITLEIDSVASSPQPPESEDSQEDGERQSLGIEYRSDFYQLTPTGSPPDSPSFANPSSGVENPALEMEDDDTSDINLTKSE